MDWSTGGQCLASFGHLIWPHQTFSCMDSSRIKYTGFFPSLPWTLTAMRPETAAAVKVKTGHFPPYKTTQNGTYLKLICTHKGGGTYNEINFVSSFEFYWFLRSDCLKVQHKLVKSTHYPSVVSQVFEKFPFCLFMYTRLGRAFSKVSGPWTAYGLHFLWWITRILNEIF
jgi:hypothetical protein